MPSGEKILRSKTFQLINDQSTDQPINQSTRNLQNILDTETTIVIRIYPDLATAQYAVALLAESGIEAFVGDRNWLQLYPMFAQQADGYKLHIFERDAEKATEILNAIDNETNC